MFLWIDSIRLVACIFRYRFVIYSWMIRCYLLLNSGIDYEYSYYSCTHLSLLPTVFIICNIRHSCYWYQECFQMLKRSIISSNNEADSNRSENERKIHAFGIWRSLNWRNRNQIFLYDNWRYYLSRYPGTCYVSFPIVNQEVNGLTSFTQLDGLTS